MLVISDARSESRGKLTGETKGDAKQTCTKLMQTTKGKLENIIINGQTNSVLVWG